MVKKVTQNFCRFRTAKQQKLLRDLQSDRNRILRNHRYDPAVLQSLLAALDSQIAKIQQTRAETYRLKAGKRWLEHNENSAGYLSRTSTVCNSSRNFQKIIHPVSGVSCEDTESKLDAIHTFYSDLYTAKDIDTNCLETMLGLVQRQLSSADAQSIIAAVTMDDLLDGAKRCPSKSSPGLDGLPYEILHLILSNPHCHSIALKVYNEAITLARFPLSWQQACIALILKKGDLADLANWRPISLINTDCKVFTRLLNACIVPLASSLITEYQAGFMRDRFIGDHGLTNKLILEDAQKTMDTGLEFVGVMLDQTKAYDLIHPSYLARVLKKFGFPPAFVDCIQNLFFNNQIFVNMNGFLSPAVSQRRGLRQGDSISPMLFNFAIEPFLQSILTNPSIRGYSLQHGASVFPNDLHYVSPHRPVKLLAYADDVLLYVHSVSEFHAIQHCLATYNKASNSMINYNKSVAFPLTGLPLSSPQGAQLQEFIVHNQRMRWYNASSTGHLPYLGFPIWFTIRQREAFTSSMLQKIESDFDPHRQRNLSMYGRATISNVLVLTKLWHVLRITTLPKAFFQQVQSLVHQFLYGKMFPKMRSSIFYLPRHRGGLGILNVAVQQQVFQFRYIKALVDENLSRPSAVPPFLFQMLSDSLQVTYGAPDATLPLLFSGWRQPRRPRILFSFLPLLFQAMDACFPSRDHASIWPQIPPAPACLSLPIREVFYCNPNHPDPPFKFSKHLSTMKMFEFFFFDPADQLLHFRSTADCSFPGILRKLHNAVSSYRLLAQRYMAFHLGLIPLPVSLPTTDIAQTRQAINSSCFTTQPFLTTFLKIADTVISVCPNHTIRHHILRSQPPIHHGRFYNHRVGIAQWKSFLRTPMAPLARTLWYRVLQQKLPNKSSLMMIPGIVDSDRCVFCNQVETTEDLLI